MTIPSHSSATCARLGALCLSLLAGACESTNAHTDADGGPGQLADAEAPGSDAGESHDCRGDEVQHRDRYASNHVAAGEVCMLEKQARTCVDSSWGEWSGTFQYDQCDIEGQKACDGVPSGGQESRTRYLSSQVAAGDACQAEVQTHTCANGLWSTWSGSFEHETCDALIEAGCGQTPNGGEESRTRYAHAQEPFAETCKAEVQTRSCAHGTWGEWKGSYEATSCVVADPVECDGTPHGGEESRTRYAEAAPAAGLSCRSEVQTRRCSNGTWATWSGTFTAPVCTATSEPTCDGAPGGAEQGRTRYAHAEEPFGSQCQAELQTRHCAQGIWSEWTGLFSEPSCTVAGPPDCDGTPHNGKDSRTRYAAAQAEYGSTCTSEVQTRRCSAGVWSGWSGSFGHTNCVVLGAQDCDGTPHGGKDSRTRYAKAEVEAGQTCQGEVQSRACNDGTWEPWSGTFAAAACSVGEPKDCADIPHGSEETRLRYAEPEAFNHSCQSETQRRVCQNGVLTDWTGSFVELACQPCVDQDGDRYGAECSLGRDCDDTRADVHPGTTDLAWNSVDENCDGALGKHLVLGQTYEHREAYRDEHLKVDRGLVVLFARSALEVRALGALDRPLAVHRDFANTYLSNEGIAHSRTYCPAGARASIGTASPTRCTPRILVRRQRHQTITTAGWPMTARSSTCVTI